MRPPFLVITPVCIFLGASLAIANGTPISFVTLFIVLVGGLAAHISVNTLNEYHDYKSGLDTETVKTPFSGGSGALPDNPEAAEQVLSLGIATLVLTVTVGLHLVQMHGLALIPIGFLGVIIVATYTPWINRNPFICLIAPGLGIGVLMVLGSHLIFSQTGLTEQIWLITAVPFFLINNLLLLNQFPDIEADRKNGRKHLPVRYGEKAASTVYLIFVLMAGITIIAGIHLTHLPQASYIALLPLAAALFAYKGSLAYPRDAERLIPYLASNVAAAVITPFVLGLTIIFG